MTTAQTDAPQGPTWARGLGWIEGGDIVLEGRKAAPYALFDIPERSERLVMDLAKLSELGPIPTPSDDRVVIDNQQPAEAFVKRHGLLWDRPQKNSDSYREYLGSWLCEGHEMLITIKLYVELRKAITTHSTEGLESYLRGLRDDGALWGSWGGSTSNDSLLESVTIQIAERISMGLKGCVPTVVAACSSPGGSGEKKGPPGLFRSSINPSNLPAVAYYTLSSMIEEKAQFKECVGCGELFRLDLKVQHSDRTYCDDACYDRTRKRKQRAKKRKSA